jgi:serine/threonine protein kinase
MRRCDTCGAELSDAEPFTVCSRCLFGTALAAPGRADAPVPPPVPADRPRFESAPRLFPRRDFFQKYEILERVAQGGQGDVWKVWDFDLRRTVAMKRLGEKALASDPSLYRFLAEAQIASQLEHPGVLPILDLGLDPDGRPFYTTPLLPGTTLGDIWQRVDRSRSAWTLPRALELLVRVCEIMAHAHSRGVIHRDLKPANVLVGAFGDVRVIDWGSAHVLDTARASFPEPLVPLNRPVIETDRGEAIWCDPASPLATALAGQPITVLFMPPEILQGQLAELSPQTDIYSVGVMLYQLLAGHPPYANADGSLPSPDDLRARILQGPPAPLRSLGRRISRDLAAICEKAMARTKPDRYATMTAFGDDLRAVLELRPVQARHPGVWLRLQKWTRRNLVPVVSGAAALAVFTSAFAITRGLRADRDAARRLSALRSADLAVRSGQWRAALKLWADAEAAGYRDPVELGLRRAEAWTVLAAPQRARAELDKLARRSDLDDRRAAVLLRLGEHELFGKDTFSRGVAHVREALAGRLTGADRAFAQGLLAESTPEAREHFRQATQLDPYHHGAHRHSLGLEFALGRRAELQTHFGVFRVLFPDDPSPGYLEAAELALQGRLPEAKSLLAQLPRADEPALHQQLGAGLERFARALEIFDLDRHLAGQHTNSTIHSQAVVDALSLLAASGPGDPTLAGSPLRVPQLPCLRHYQEGWLALGALALPVLNDPAPVVQRIKTSWQRHPEALLPVFAASLLAAQQPDEGAKSWPVLGLEAELLQMAAGSPSILPSLPRWSRFRAAQVQLELARAGLTNSTLARQACLEHIRRAAAAAETSAVECQAYLDMAFALDDHDLLHALLARWERLQPDAPTLLRRRIEMEIADGAWGDALALLDKLLAKAPADAWALEQKRIVRERLRAILEAIPPSTKPNLQIKSQP